MLQPVGVGHKVLADYTHLVGRELASEVKERAELLAERAADEMGVVGERLVADTYRLQQRKLLPSALAAWCWGTNGRGRRAASGRERLPIRYGRVTDPLRTRRLGRKAVDTPFSRRVVPVTV